MGMPRYVMLLFAFLWCTNITQAAPQAAATLTNQIDRINLAPHLDILEDPQRALSIQQVMSPAYATQFYPNTQDIPNFGRTHSAYWLRFTLNNQSELKWYARINALLGHDVALYILSADGQVITDAIAHYMPNHGLHAWSLSLPEQKTLQFYIRATNGNAIFSLPIELFTADSFVEQTRTNHNLYASIIAALLIMAVYNLLSFLVLRESSYLSLSIHIASVAAIVHITNPVYTGLDFLENTASHFFTAPIYIAVISFLIFCRQLLQTNVNVPRLDKLIRGITYLSTGLFFVTGYVPQGTFLPQLMFVIAFALVMVASVIRSLKSDRIARYFLAIFLLIILMVIPNAVINIVADTQWQSANLYSTGIATLLFLLLLSIVQSEKVRGWRETEQRATAAKEAADNFLMTISHELRTPMQTLIGIGELLKTTPLNPTQRDYLHKQETASEHMLGLVNDMLDLGSISKGKQIPHQAHETFDLQNIIDDLSELFRVAAEQKGLKLIVSITPSSCPPLSGDAKHLKQVLVNLLDNAIKYTEQGSVKLHIELRKDQHLPVMTAAFEISDTGIGIPVEQQAHLFKPFFQVNHPGRQRSGSGLGLAISHQWVGQMGGELQVRSQPNAGACFFFTLNLSIPTENKHAQITAGAASRSKTDLTPLQNLRILLVDDDSLNQLIGKKLLTSRGADVRLASSGQEAIHQIREQRFDLVLMDLDLPDMDGYKTTRTIRADKNTPDCPIIALTAHAIGQERENCLNAGMNDYLAKPFTIGALTDVILKHYRSDS